MQCDVHNTQLEKVGSVELPDAVFAVEVKKALLWEQVKAQLASRRAGTHKTKNVGEVRGTGKKPYKQKGTGRARQGSERAPQFVHGGVAMGPRPRDYTVRLPRGARRAALRSALSDRLEGKNLLVLDGFALAGPKTKTVEAFLAKLGTANTLIVDVKNDALSRSTRNLRKAKFVDAAAINVYDIINHDKLVVTQSALPVIVNRALKPGGAA